MAVPVDPNPPIKAIVWVVPHGQTATNAHVLPVQPSSYTWKEEDVSASDAGRTEDTVMQKKRIGQVVGLELSFQNLRTDAASAVLNLFEPEYIDVRYLDLKAGRYLTAEFYVGNRNAPMYNASMGLWSNLSFNIIKRSGV